MPTGVDFWKAPPLITALTDNALEADKWGDDGFELAYRMGPIYDILRHKDTRTPLAIAVYGDWGTGKTTAMRWLEGLARQWNQAIPPAGHTKISLRPVWFYPWKYHSKEDVWRGLVSEVIINSIDVREASTATVVNAAKRFGLFLGRSFVHALANIKLKAKVKEPVTGATEGEMEVSLAAIREILAEYREAAHPEKAFLNEFEDSLKEWVANTLSKHGDERMVIFVDDLDRCLPEVALQVLEALKLYLNIPNLIFIVGVDRGVVDHLVREHYKKFGLDESKSRNYLAKMFQVEVHVGPSEKQIKQFLKKQLASLEVWQSELTDQERGPLDEAILSLAEQNPREVKRLINGALMLGSGARLGSGLNPKAADVSFAQGVQVFLVHRVLAAEFPRLERLVRRDIGTEFFRAWHRAIQDGGPTALPSLPTNTTEMVLSLDPEFLRSLRTPGPVGKAHGVAASWSRTLTKAATAVTVRAAGVELGVPEPARSREEQEVEAKRAAFVEFLKSLPAPYQPIFAERRFAALLPLIEHQVLGVLMQLDYPAEGGGLATTVAGPGEFEGDARIVAEAVAEQVNKPADQLTKSDYEKVTTLDLSSQSLTSLEPIKGLTSLQSLSLFGTPVASLEPIKGLTSLLWLSLSSTQVASLEPIKGLTSLQSLSLSGTPVDSLEPIKGLTSLQRLSLGITPVASLEPIKGLTSLLQLSLDSTPVASLEPIKGLASLKLLSLSGTQVASLEPVKGLTSLESLYLNNTPVASLEPLFKLHWLKNLSIAACEQLTPAAVERFRKARPRCTVNQVLPGVAG